MACPSDRGQPYTCPDRVLADKGHRFRCCRRTYGAKAFGTPLTSAVISELAVAPDWVVRWPSIRRPTADATSSSKDPTVEFVSPPGAPRSGGLFHCATRAQPATDPAVPASAGAAAPAHTIARRGTWRSALESPSRTVLEFELRVRPGAGSGAPVPARSAGQRADPRPRRDAATLIPTERGRWGGRRCEVPNPALTETGGDELAHCGRGLRRHAHHRGASRLLHVATGVPPPRALARPAGHERAASVRMSTAPGEDSASARARARARAIAMLTHRWTVHHARMVMTYPCTRTIQKASVIRDTKKARGGETPFLRRSDPAA